MRICQRVLLTRLSVFPALISCQNTTTNATTASTFYLDRTETQFSINIADDSDDIFIYYASPAYSWVGVGFGEKMEGSLMFIMYPNAKSDSTHYSILTSSQVARWILTGSRRNNLTAHRLQDFRANIQLLDIPHCPPRNPDRRRYAHLESAVWQLSLLH